MVLSSFSVDWYHKGESLISPEMNQQSRRKRTPSLFHHPKSRSRENLQREWTSYHPRSNWTSNPSFICPHNKSNWTKTQIQPRDEVPLLHWRKCAPPNKKARHSKLTPRYLNSSIQTPQKSPRNASRYSCTCTYKSIWPSSSWWKYHTTTSGYYGS